MTQRILGSVVAAALLTTTVSANDALIQRFEKMEQEMAALKAELNALKAENSKLSNQLSTPAVATESTKEKAKLKETLEDIEDQLASINKRTSGSNLKWDVDFRTSIDNVQYEMADGSSAHNDAVFSNRLWLNMNYAATKNLSFTGQLAYNKTFGQRTVSNPALAGMEGFDWVSGEAAYDDTLRVRSAYFFYQDDELLGADIPWTFSIGRRPSTEGHLINFRDDLKASSPLAHAVNVEFDGASAKFGTEELIGLEGSYFKLCAGRGMSEAEPRFASTPYAGDKAATTNDIDMVGIIVVPFDNKQYSTGFQYTYANNLIDSNGLGGFDTVGGLYTATAFAMVNGIGDGINDFLDETIVFASGAMSKTDPYASSTGMLGSTESETGYSYWVGTQFPSLISDDGRWGVEYNHGNKYWRSITYGEDTLIGSKIAARGDAYEMYFTEPLVKDILSLQLRYTYINYDYAGSNGFFGNATGTPTKISNGMVGGAGIVDTAQDIRMYLRYKF